MSVEKKVPTGIDEIEAGFTAEPSLSPIEKLEADSYIVSGAEMEQEMKEAGLETVEAPVKEAVPIAETAIGIEEGKFTDVPELTPIERIDTDSYIVSEPEMEADLAAAGIEVPEKKEGGIDLPDAIAQEESVFTTEPELSPIEQLDIDELSASKAEIADDMKKAGIL